MTFRSFLSPMANRAQVRTNSKHCPLFYPPLSSPLPNSGYEKLKERQ